MNARGRQIKCESIRLSDVAARTTTDYAEIIVGDGVPSGAYGRDAGATMLYLRKDASSANTCVYVTHNGGTAWDPIEADATSAAFTDGSTWYTTDTLQGLADAVVAALGGTSQGVRNWTNGTGTRLTDNDSFYTAVNKLDQGFVDLLSTVNGKGASLVSIEDVATLITATTVEGALAEIAAKIAALGAENTDGQLRIPLLAGVADGGTWAPSVTTGGLVGVARTAADAPSSYWVDVPVPTRTTASKGIKPTGLRVNYQVATADVADVRFELWKVTQGADNAARAAAVLFGEDDADYDGAHNTAAKRGDDTAAPELHLAIVTDAGAPAYVGAGESLLLRCFVDGDAGAAGVVTVTDAVLLYSETLVDLS